MATLRRSVIRAALLLIGAVLAARCALVGAAAAPADPYPRIAASYLLVRDDTLLWAHEPDRPLPMASLAKLMTALVVLERGFDAARWLPVGQAAADVEPARIGLRAGEQISAAGALAAMMVHSANDACRVLVDGSGLSTPAFAAAMNDKARALGMHATHFVDPCGFDAEGQHGTASDLLRLARSAAAQPLLATLAAQRSGELTTRAGRRIGFATTNALLGRLDGAVGLKTGYTRTAGQCLIALVRRDGHELWLVMLGGEQRWWLSHGIINAALATADR